MIQHNEPTAPLDYRPECTGCRQRWTPESEDTPERRCPTCVAGTSTWRPVRTAPFDKLIQYALRIDGHLIRCEGFRIERADFDDERVMPIGVLQSERHSGNFWTNGDEDEPSEHLESDVHGWLPLGELPTERL